jgi:tight adherence protein B
VAALLSVLIAWLFYNAIWGVIFSVPFLFAIRKQYIQDCHRRHTMAEEKKFCDGIQAVSSSLSSGASPEHAFADASKELTLLYGPEDEMTRGFSGIVRKMKRGIPLERAVKEFAQTSGSESARNFADVFQSAKRLGGNLIAIIGSTVRLMSDGQEVREEIDTVLSGRWFEQRVMAAMPFALVLYLKVALPGFLNPLYGNVMGVILMSVCLGGILVSLELSRKISSIRV